MSTAIPNPAAMPSKSSAAVEKKLYEVAKEALKEKNALEKEQIKQARKMVEDSLTHVSPDFEFNYETLHGDTANAIYGRIVNEHIQQKLLDGKNPKDIYESTKNIFLFTNQRSAPINIAVSDNFGKFVESGFFGYRSHEWKWVAYCDNFHIKGFNYSRYTAKKVGEDIYLEKTGALKRDTKNALLQEIANIEETDVDSIRDNVRYLHNTEDMERYLSQDFSREIMEVNNEFELEDEIRQLWENTWLNTPFHNILMENRLNAIYKKKTKVQKAIANEKILAQRNKVAAIFTDASGSNNSKRVGVAAVCTDGNVKSMAFNAPKVSISVQYGEARAIAMAVEMIENTDSLSRKWLISSDSKGIVRTINQYIAKVRAKKGVVIENVLRKYCYKIAKRIVKLEEKGLVIKLKWHKGHTEDNVFNDAADRLANLERRMRGGVRASEGKKIITNNIMHELENKKSVIKMDEKLEKMFHGNKIVSSNPKN